MSQIPVHIDQNFLTSLHGCRHCSHKLKILQGNSTFMGCSHPHRLRVTETLLPCRYYSIAADENPAELITPPVGIERYIFGHVAKGAVVAGMDFKD